MIRRFARLAAVLLAALLSARPLSAIELRGGVRSADGAPLTGVELDVMPLEPTAVRAARELAGRSLTAIAAGKTDRDGRCRI